MVRKLVLSFVAVLGFVAFAYSQNKQVSGAVTDADGLPIAGATVLVEGTQVGVTTGADGKYTLSTSPNAKLSFSFIGLENQVVAVNSRSVINVQLKEDAKAIDDVVVVGYGTGRKVGTIIGSVDQVKADKIQDRPTNNVMDAMQGQVPGLQIFNTTGELTDASVIRLHGMGSISAGNEPLILLDGAPITTGTLLAMNQNDIASMNVLKDASATSIYGSRAANGVIYVVSKRGNRGQEGASVTLRTQYSISNAIKPRMRAMDTPTLIDYQAAVVAAKNGMDYTNAEDLAIARNFVVNDMYGRPIDESVNVNWFDELMRDNAPMYSVDLGISGGSQRTSYYVSANYLSQDGVMPGSNLDRYTFRTNIESQANNWLKVGMNLGLGYQKAANATTAKSAGSLYGSNPIFASLTIPSFQEAYDKDGQIIKFLDIAGYTNPMVDHNYYYKTNNRLQINGSTFVEINPVKGLTIRSQLSANAFDFRSKGVSSPSTPTATGVRGTGSVTEGFQRNYDWTLTNTVEYKFAVAPKHSFTALVGQETLYGATENMSIGVKGVTNPDLVYISKGTEVTALPTYKLGAYAYNSVFGRLEYDFSEKYFADASVRYDASSRFGVNNRGATFWSVGVMWNIAKEDFLKDNSAITALSIKASYGTQGNSGIGNYDQYELLASSKYTYAGAPAWYIGNSGNPSLAWEQQGTTTIGANIGLWRKLKLNVEWYRRSTSDMLMPKPLAPSAGFSEQIWNIGAMTNSGMDVSLNYDIVSNKDWFVGFYTNLNYNSNKITRLWEKDLQMASMGGGSMMAYFVGKPYGSFYAQEWRGVDPQTGAPQWTNAEGGVTNDFNEAVEKDLNKSIQAPLSGGFGFNVSWKGIGINADFTWVSGNYMVNNNSYFTNNTYFALGMNQAVDALDFWKNPGDKTSLPALNYESQFDSRMIEDASFMRLKNLQISYTIPSEWLRKSKIIKGFKVYVGARNLWTITSYRGLDPEVAGGDMTGSIGPFDTDVYPNSRQWTFGCEFKF